MRLPSLAVAAALAAGCGTTTDTSFPCALPVGDAPVRGPADAWVTVMEFADYECPYCGIMEPGTVQLVADYPDDVRLVFKNLPLAQHDHAFAAAVAAICAGQQGQYWEMHDLLFAHQNALDDASLASYAATLAIDTAVWTRCYANGTGTVDTGSGRAADVILNDEYDATTAKITGTPTQFINGVRAVGAIDYTTLTGLVTTALSAAKASGVAQADYYTHVVSTVACTP